MVLLEDYTYKLKRELGIELGLNFSH